MKLGRGRAPAADFFFFFEIKRIVRHFLVLFQNVFLNSCKSFGMSHCLRPVSPRLLTSLLHNAPLISVLRTFNLQLTFNSSICEIQRIFYLDE